MTTCDFVNTTVLFDAINSLLSLAGPLVLFQKREGVVACTAPGSYGRSPRPFFSLSDVLIATKQAHSSGIYQIDRQLGD